MFRSTKSVKASIGAVSYMPGGMFDLVLTSLFINILSLAMPLAFPAAMALGYDPVWFGIIVTKTVEIGLLTPPLGLNAYVASASTGVPLGRIFRGLVPFIGVELVILGTLIAFPDLSLWLPALMGR